MDIEDRQQQQSQEDQNEPQLFKDIRYYLINSNDPNTESLLKSQRANEEKYLTSHVTHVICDNPENNSEYIDAKELFELTIVKSDWVRRCIEVNTLLDVNGFSLDTNGLFSRVVAVGLSLPDRLAKQLKSQIEYYNGTCERQITPQSTHAFTLTYDEQLFERISRFNANIRFITPDWLTDCIEANAVCDEIKYNPKYLMDRQEVKEMLGVQLKEQEQNEIRNEESRESNETHRLQQQHYTPIITITTDNFFNQNTSDTLDEQTKALEAANQLKAKSKKSRSSKSMASPQHSSSASVLPQTSNHPQPKPPATTTNGTTTATFNFDMNEIFQSVICESIKKPIRILSDLTGEDEAEPTFNRLYTDTYPTRDNHHIQPNRFLLGCCFYMRPLETFYSKEVLQEWQKIIEHYGGRVVIDGDSNDITHFMCINRTDPHYKHAFDIQSRIVTQFWLEDVLKEEKLKAPWRAYHFPSVFLKPTGPLTNHIISLHGFRGKEKLILKSLIYLLNGKYTSYLNQQNSVLISNTSTNSKKMEKAKEWNIPIVNGVWLMELYLGNYYALNEKLDERYVDLDLDHFAYDAIYVQDMMKPWKRPINVPLDKIKDISNQENLSPLKRRNSSDASNTATENVKRQRTIEPNATWTRPSSTVPAVLFTGVNHNDLMQYQHDIVSLGGLIVKHPSQATHLIVGKLERTGKLLACMNYSGCIVSINWLLDSKRDGRLLDTKEYLIRNEEFEKKYHCCIGESLERARQATTPILSPFKFYLSPSVKPSVEQIEEVVKSAGGHVQHSVPTLKQINENIDQKYSISKYVIIAAQEDLSILNAFIENNIPIYNEEFVFSSIMRQQIEPSLYRVSLTSQSQPTAMPATATPQIIT